MQSKEKKNRVLRNFVLPFCSHIERLVLNSNQYLICLYNAKDRNACRKCVCACIFFCLTALLNNTPICLCNMKSLRMVLVSRSMNKTFDWTSRYIWTGIWRYSDDWILYKQSWKIDIIDDWNEGKTTTRMS